MSKKNSKPLAVLAALVIGAVAAQPLLAAEGAAGQTAGKAAASTAAPDTGKAAPTTTEQSTKGAAEKLTEEAHHKAVNYSQDAASAVAAVVDAIALLDQGKKAEATDKLATASGKLEVAIAADPALAFIPIAYNVESHVLIATPDEIDNTVEQAEDLLDDGRVQEARVLLQDVRSEIVTTVVVLPVATYPAAIKDAAGLIAEDKLEEARAVLLSAMGTLVETSEIIPVPLVAAAEAVARAEDQAKENKDAALASLDLAKEQLKIAKKMGYVTKDGYKKLKKRIKEIHKEIEGKNESAGMFAKLKEEFKGWFSPSDETKAGEEKKAAPEQKK